MKRPELVADTGVACSAWALKGSSPHDGLLAPCHCKGPFLQGSCSCSVATTLIACSGLKRGLEMCSRRTVWLHRSMTGSSPEELPLPSERDATWRAMTRGEEGRGGMGWDITKGAGESGAAGRKRQYVASGPLRHLAHGPQQLGAPHTQRRSGRGAQRRQRLQPRAAAQPAAPHAGRGAVQLARWEDVG